MREISSNEAVGFLMKKDELNYVELIDHLIKFPEDNFTIYKDDNNTDIIIIQDYSQDKEVHIFSNEITNFTKEVLFNIKQNENINIHFWNKEIHKEANQIFEIEFINSTLRYIFKRKDKSVNYGKASPLNEKHLSVVKKYCAKEQSKLPVSHPLRLNNVLLRERINDYPAKIFGEIVDNQLISYVIISPYDLGKEEYYIWDVSNIWTSNEYRRQGFAKDCLKKSTSWLLENNKIPYYSVSKNNEASVSTCESVGFEKYGEDFRYKLLGYK